MQEKIEKGIGWLQKLLHLQEKFGFFSILKSLFILLITGYVVFFALNPRYLLDKMEQVQTEQHNDAVSRRMSADANIRMIFNRILPTLDADRVWLIELHNGAKNLTTGLPFLYGDMRIALYQGDKPLGVLGISFCGDKQMDASAVGKTIRKCGVQIATLLSN